MSAPPVRSTAAIVIHAPKDLRIDNVPLPAPGPDEVEVAVGAGGICGSDLHYYLHGGFGAVRLREPMVLGHELAGTVAATGVEVADIRPGDRVAINPSRPCGTCRFCAMGLANHCLDMRFLGSAMRMPHVHGGFRQRIVLPERQCVRVPDGLSLAEAAFAEPLAVALHAVRQAGDLVGRRVLVTGCGPIGGLVLLAARLAGAVEIVATDVAPAALAAATRLGADRVIDAARSEGFSEFERDKGWFDVLIEASGNAAALRAALPALRPRGTAVLVGLGGEAALPLDMIVAKEITLRGTFRFHEEFAAAVRYLGAGRVDVLPLLTETVPFREAARAFALAADRGRAMKVQIAFEG